MRNALALMLASVVAALLISAVWFWTSSPRVELSVANTVGAASAERVAPSAGADFAREDVEVTGAIPDKSLSPPPPDGACAKPDALGVSRVVEVDTTGGPAFGFQHFKQLDFLADREVVLTFDDGPWPGRTQAVLKALADECTKAVFFRSANTPLIIRRSSGRWRLPGIRLAPTPGRMPTSTARR
jgi:hypothetical protein